MAKPKLALIPAAQGTKFYSVLPSDGTGDFTFTRGSVATRINAQGLIENVASGQSRLDYPLIDGVQKGCPHHILEPQRTNVLLQSNGFDTTWAFTRASVSQEHISPDGALNAWAFIDNATDSTHLMVQSVSLGAVTSTASIYAKAGTRDFIAFRFEGSTGVDYVYFNVKNGTIGDVNSDYIDVKIENAGNGWYRCIATRVLGASGNQFIILSADKNGDPTYSGNGDNALYIYGSQVEAGSYATSYIPTTSTTVTRSAETANGAGNSTTFNDSEGVLMAEISALADDGTFRMIGVFDEKTTNEDRIQIYYRNDANKISFLIEENNVNQFVKTLDVTTIQYNKVALKYGNTSKVYINGFKLAEESGVAIPNNLQRLSFNEQNGSNNFYGNTKQVQYFNSALADTQLEQLTSWQSFRDMANGQLYTIE